MLTVKDYVRDALFTAALFGSIGAAFAQTPPANSGDVQSAQSPKVPGHNGIEEPSAKPASATDPTSVFVNGSLNIPNAPKDTSTTPAKFSAVNARLDALPIMARGPTLTDAQRKLIIDHVTSAGPLPVPYAGPTTELPATIATHAWPADVLQQAPSLADTKYLAVPGKILLVRPDNSIVVGEIDH
jgi:hypothetical protein